MKKFLTSKIFLAIITLIIVGGIGVYAGSQMFANQIIYNNTTVDAALNDLYTKVNTARSYTSLDNDFLETGTFVGNTVITNNNPNSLYGLSMTGASTANGLPGNRWEKEMDFTDLSFLTFFAKKGANHGAVTIFIDDANTEIYFRSYSDLDSNWKKIAVDLTEIQGVHKLIICCGWGDSTGSSSSNTQYYDIRLY